MKIDVFDYPLSFDAPSPGENPTNIRTNFLSPETGLLESMAYICAADSMGLSSFNFSVVGSERRIFSGTECVSAVQDHQGR